MKRLVVTVVLVSCLARGWAMPTKAELTKAQPLVVELMAPAMEAYKSATAKDKTAAAVKVGDASSEFAKAAETESARFLLLKGAVNFYTRGEAYDKAADAADEIRASIRDIDPAVLAEIISKATVRATSKKAPRLWAIYRQAKTQVKAAADSKSLANQLKAKPDSLSIRRTYAEALAVSGDWKAALAEFAKLNDKTAIEAKAELDGSAKDAEVGEFWWTYEPTYENVGNAFRCRAAMYYQKALAASEISGLKKQLVERRVAEYACREPPRDPRVQERLFQLPTTGRGPEIALKIVSDCELNFVSCPSGTFTMGFLDGNSCLKKHKVHISRPFWISKFLVTYAQWDAFMGKMPRRKAEKCQFCLDVLGGDQTPAALSYCQSLDFLSKLNDRFKGFLPPGYVFRFASEAECEYTAKSGKSDYNAKYDAEGEVVSLKERLEAVKNKGYAVPDWGRWPWRVPYFAVGYRKANKWGVHDMLAFGWMYVLDSVKAKCETDTESLTPCYEEGSVDPIQLCEDPDAWGVVRGCGWGFDGKYLGRTWVKFLFRLGNAEHDDGFLRIVVGPDLVSEWKAKQKASGAAVPVANNSTPKIVGVSPANGDQAVDAGVGEVVVRFDRSMQTGLSLTGFDWSKIAVGKPKWDEAMTTLRVPVKLKPMTRYQLGFNSRSHMNFKSKEGVPLAPYMHEFRTK